MGVSTQTVMKKMADELDKARQTSHDESKRIKHISNIKLLSELIIDEYEQRLLLKEKHVQAHMNDKNMDENTFSSTDTVDNNDGTSIFDF